MSGRPSSRREGVGIVRYYSILTRETSFLDDVLRGLSLPQKSIPPKYFYDERGSQLFERICELPEYYPTRTEMAIMARHVGEIVTLLGPDAQLVEFGSGASVKSRLLVDRLEPSLYVPIDISEVALREACKALALMFPWLNISAVMADFSEPLRLPEFVGIPVHRKVVYFPGSTIGNFAPGEALEFLKGVRDIVGPGGMLLIGVDLKKDKRVLDAAYDDAQGRDRRVQPEPAPPDQPRAGRRFPGQALPAQGVLRRARRLDRDAPREPVRQFVNVGGQRFEFPGRARRSTRRSPASTRSRSSSSSPRVRGSTPRRHGPTRRISSPCTR